MPWWAASNKWVMYYDRDVQAEFKRYCKDLLTHKNPYRNNLARVDDSGIALVELMNENFFSVKGYDLYRRMPARFQRSLIGRWNEWLTKTYGDHQTMLAEWKKAQGAMGEMLVAEAEWADKPSGWVINKPSAGLDFSFGHPGPNNKKAIRLSPVTLTEQD